MIILASIDRIEGEYAVCELEENMVDIPLIDIPFEVQSGDILQMELQEGKYIVFGKDEEEKQRRLERIRKLFSRNNQ
jgi:hypothetical protein